MKSSAASHLRVVLYSSLVIVGVAAVFGTFKYFSTNSGEIDLASTSGQRPLIDKSNVTGKTGKVENEPRAIMNDSHMTEDWGKPKVDAERAWTVTQGSKDIIVAVIDTGCDVNHEDLKENIWVNPGETGKDSAGRDKATNGIDDDKNGFVDDVNGWNFVSNNNSLIDNHGHGTHIAGIIGAVAGNGKGIAGVAPQVSLMCLKYFDPKVPSTDNLKNTIQAIHYAIKMGAHIINYSGGGTEPSPEEKAAVEESRKAGILFVAAAGNERSNSDKFKYYPADYGISNVISVTAIDPSTSVLPSSNYGTETVDIAAPGQNILSTLPGNSYGFMTGTSQATAFVSGGGVLIKARNRKFGMEEVKKFILDTGSVQKSLVGKARSYRLLNLYNAVVMQDNNMVVTGAKLNSSEQHKLRFAIEDPAQNINSFGQKLLLKVEKNNLDSQKRINGRLATDKPTN